VLFLWTWCFFACVLVFFPRSALLFCMDSYVFFVGVIVVRRGYGVFRRSRYLLNDLFCFFFHRNCCFLHGFLCVSCGVIVFGVDSGLFSLGVYCFLYGFSCLLIFLGIIVFRRGYSVFPSASLFVEWIILFLPSELLFFCMGSGVLLVELLFFGVDCGVLRNVCFFFWHGFLFFFVRIIVFQMGYDVFPSEPLFFEWSIVCFHRNYCFLHGFLCFSCGIIVFGVDCDVLRSVFFLFAWILMFFVGIIVFQNVMVFFRRNRYFLTG